MQQSRWILAVTAFVAFLPASVTAQQIHAPAGGAYGSNGQWYKGGQFMPSGSSGNSGILPNASMSSYRTSPAGAAYQQNMAAMQASMAQDMRLNAEIRAQKQARTRARVQARTPNFMPTTWSNLELATSRLNTAKLLIKTGKPEAAMKWLEEVIQSDASPETVAEAKKLLDSLTKKDKIAG